MKGAAKPSICNLKLAAWNHVLFYPIQNPKSDIRHPKSRPPLARSLFQNRPSSCTRRSRRRPPDGGRRASSALRPWARAVGGLSLGRRRTTEGGPRGPRNRRLAGWGMRRCEDGPVRRRHAIHPRRYWHDPPPSSQCRIPEVGPRIRPGRAWHRWYRCPLILDAPGRGDGVPHILQHRLAAHDDGHDQPATQLWQQTMNDPAATISVVAPIASGP